jgi:hypothetical protein
MKLEQGDAFEITYAAWIREHLPHYEPIWAAFIGHNGNGQPLPMNGLAESQDVARKKFYQAHYTFATFAQELDTLLGQMDAGAGHVTTFEAFNREQQRLRQAVTLVGQIRDMFKIIDEALKMRGRLYEPMQDCYAMRSHILHGPRMPARCEDGFLMIPKIATQNAKIGEWDDKSVWDDFAASEFVSFADFCSSLRSEFFKLVGELHPKVFSAADAFFEGRRVQKPAKVQVFAQGSLSGLGVFPAVSAYFPPPSGVR